MRSKRLKMGSKSIYLLIISLVLLCFLVFSSAVDISYDGRAITINTQRAIILSGSIHYPRSTPEMWPDLIMKAKEGGLDAIDTYVFWNAHEPRRRQYDFTGNLDLIRFIKTVQSAELYVVLRIGPYVCAEWNYGGFPVWLHNMPGIELRTDNDIYKNEMANFTTLIVDMVRKEKLFASQGGPIIIAQIENEYGDVKWAYGEAGNSYINWAANLAESLKIGIPWIMCQESDAPKPMINTCNGYYCDTFKPNNENVPKMWTENWTGWYKNWGGRTPHRTAEDLAFSVARFFQFGGTFQNYYMYHGGTNFGRTAGAYFTTSYDYDAPLDEYGNLNQPKWGHLKKLHEILKSMELALVYGDVTTTEYGSYMYTSTKYTFAGISSCFLGNANWDTDFRINFEGNDYVVPAWSVSILPDCKNVVYNTAMVNSQTNVMVMRKAENESSVLSWAWKPEITKETGLMGMAGKASNNGLLEQKAVTNDTSDYLWYMTSFHLNESDPILNHGPITLIANTNGHVLHSFVNGEHQGSKWGTNGAFKIAFEQKIRLFPGHNMVDFLSVTVGLQNYGPKYDLIQTGLSGVRLISEDKTAIMDLSSHEWLYKVGLEGLHEQIFNAESPYSKAWLHSNLPRNSIMNWYKITFKTPLGSDPVVVDLQGMGKGKAWVNGNSIGRYWSTFLASENGCSETCDYRGPYNKDKCNTNCGEPTQRWYHVPRSFLRDDMNTLVLFQEMGGSPELVNFQTVAVGSVCANAYEGNTLELSCQGNGRTFSAIKFASFGNPKGKCGSFIKGTCESAKSLSILKEACLGKESCSVVVSEQTFGSSGCQNNTNRLAVEILCSI